MKTKPVTRSEYLAAALQQFAKNGFATTTTRSIMADLGLSPGALYHYFSGKTDLLYGVLDGAYRPILEGLKEIFVVHRDDRVDVRLAESLIYTALQFIFRRSELYLVDSDLRFLEPERQREIRTLLREYNSLIRGLFTEGISTGLWPPIDETILANCVFGLMRSRWYRMDGSMTPVELAEFETLCVFRILQHEMPARCTAHITPQSNEGAIEPANVQRKRREQRSR